MPNKTICEYIWLDAEGKARSKTNVLQGLVSRLSDLPVWDYDGSSTGQAEGKDSEVLLQPVAWYPDPFRRENLDLLHGIVSTKLVLCETYLPDEKRTPHPTNTRYYALKIFEEGNASELKPLFGIEQEFFLVKNGKPIEFHNNRFPPPQGPYYCSTGGDYMSGRECIEKAFMNCLFAGLSLTGLNAEVAPSQWEFQVCAEGIVAADQLCVMRYILDRTAERYGGSIDFDPKPIPGDWNGSGCHTNFSTKPMRDKGGYKIILDAIQKLKIKHELHMKCYGKGNERRLTGAHETAPFHVFSSGVGESRSQCSNSTVYRKGSMWLFGGSSARVEYGSLYGDVDDI